MGSAPPPLTVEAVLDDLRRDGLVVAAQVLGHEIVVARAEAEAAQRQVAAIDVWSRNLAKGVTCRYWEGGPEALKHLPDLDGLRWLERHMEHLGRLQHDYCNDVVRLRSGFRRALGLAKRAMGVLRGA